MSRKKRKYFDGNRYDNASHKNQNRKKSQQVTAKTNKITTQLDAEQNVNTKKILKQLVKHYYQNNTNNNEKM